MVRVNQYGMLSIVIVAFAVNLAAQTLPSSYYGQLSFDYAGTMNGSFNAGATELPDTLVPPTSFAGGIIFSFNDTTHILMPAYQQITDSTYDVFIIYLCDDGGGVEPQTWTLPGDITDLQALAAFIPGIDSAFVAGLLNLVADTTGGIPALDLLLGQLIDEIAPYTYFAATGTIQLDIISPDTIGGVFAGSFLQAGFPPPFITVTNGAFNFQGAILPPLATTPEDVLPSQVKLHAAYPNPFNASVTLGYFLSRSAAIEFAVFDLSGRQVAELDKGYRQAGNNSLTWTANDFSSGVYLVRLNTANSSQFQKVLLLK
ncbi:MAG: T9SS type A sorting domain-containing protein [Candidatus Marinimicrobia bacterium]|nr:T9SS type A sorting domain-containing protein [Candidatus Neomarinimicrobiota bacterium]